MNDLKVTFKRRRGISPVIAVLLLILIAVAAGVMTYAFVIGWVGGATKSTPAAQGQLALDYATADAGTGTIEAYVRNVGGVNEEIVKAYVTAPDGSVTPIDISPSVSIAPNDVGYVSLSVSMTPGYVYTVKLVCLDGTSLVFQVRAHA